MVEERSHLAIGEVLSLLHDEFPDVTISKIRFLESQGLVDPERTPSGYRKFYDADVERLRWILLQQKERFLPLKVIKDRLAELDAAGLPLDAALPDGIPAGGAPAGGEEEETRTGASLSVVRSSGPADDAELAPEPGQGALSLVALPDRPAAPTAGSPAPRWPAAPSLEPVADQTSATSATSVASAMGAAGPADGGRSTADDTTGPVTVEPATEEPAAIETAAEAAEPEAVVVVAAEVDAEGAGDDVAGEDPAGVEGLEIESRDAEVSRIDEAGPTRPGARPGAVAPASGDPDTMTLEELAVATGLEPAAITELQQFGLVIPSGTVGGTTYFDQIALEVARTAAGFAGHGVEARHLRAWRNSAEREVSIFEQVVMPLLRQRNPQARGQAEATLAELAGLGADLRAALVRQALRSVR
jgi:DNA-binding transcriptional MerR regulator